MGVLDIKLCLASKIGGDNRVQSAEVGAGGAIALERAVR
jgi:hypothetical protein